MRDLLRVLGYISLVVHTASLYCIFTGFSLFALCCFFMAFTSAHDGVIVSRLFNESTTLVLLPLW